MKRGGGDDDEEEEEEDMVFTQADPSPKPTVSKPISGKAIRCAGQKVTRVKKKRKLNVPGNYLIVFKVYDGIIN